MEEPTAFDRPVVIADTVGHLRDLLTFPLRAARRRRGLAAAVLAMGLAATAVAVVIVPPTYLVLVRIMAQRTLVAMPALGSASRVASGANDAPQESPSDVVFSRDNLVDIVREAGLMEAWPSIVGPTGKLRLRVAQALRGPPSDSDRVDALVGLLRKRLWVGAMLGDDGRGVITVGVDWPDPRTGFLIIETAQRNLLERQYSKDLAQIDASVQILSTHLDSARHALERSVGELARATRGQPLSGGPGADAGVGAGRPAAAPPSPAAAEEAATLQARLATDRALIADLEEVRRERTAALQTELAEMEGKYGAANPAVTAVQQSIHALSGDSPQIVGLRGAERALRARLATLGFPELAASAGPVDAALARAAMESLLQDGHVPLEDPNVTFARHRVETNVRTAEDLLSRLESARIQLEATRASFRYTYTIASPPRLPRKPTSPDLALLVVGGIGLALVLALFAATAFDLASDRMVEAWQVRQEFGVPVMAQLSASPAAGHVPHEARSRRPLAFIATVPLVAAVLAISLALMALTGSPIASASPLIVLLGVYGLWMLPLRYTLYAFMGLVVLADMTPHSPVDTAALWYPPFHILFTVLIENLNKITGIEALRFSGAEACVLLILSLLMLRSRRRNLGQWVTSVHSPQPLNLAIGISFATVLFLEVLGVIRGGADVRQSLYQFRFEFWLPVLTFLVLNAFQRMRDFVGIGLVLTGVAFMKVCVGIYYYYVIARPLNIKPAVATSHWDTVLFVMVIAMWVGAAAFRPTARRVAAALFVLLFGIVGMVVNNRRTAFVSLIAVLFLLFLLLPRRFKRPVTRATILLSPLIVAYLVVGSVKQTGVFAPAAIVLSVATQKDASSATRDIENFNLLVTLRQHTLLGSGWGHMYVEWVKAYDISKAFAQYRYQAHNSVLWLWSIGGLFGFTALWLPICVGVFFAARSHRLARSPGERLITYVALSAYITYLLQAWADLGTQSWTSVSVLACAIGVSGKLPTITGAWSNAIPLFRRPHRFVPRPRGPVAEDVAA